MVVGSTSPVLIVITDGLGYSPQTQKEILEEAYNELKPELAPNVRDAGPYALNPVYDELPEPDTSLADAARLRNLARRLNPEFRARRVVPTLQKLASRKRYVPWVKLSPEVCDFRNNNLSVPTHASGVWVGFNYAVPAVQGNSETGHQNIANLTRARQTPTVISDAIKSGEFYSREPLVSELKSTLAKGAKINFSFMLSGISGSDGQVHSTWLHLEAFLKLLFEHCSAPPSAVRMLAILDGRDSPVDGSLRESSDHRGYLRELLALLDGYKVNTCQKWVIGRTTAMDRDYQEHNLKQTYDLLLKAKGRPCATFDDLLRHIATQHGAGIGDSDIAPCTIGEAATIGAGDLFVNLNYRSDRQRALTAMLLGNTDFLKNQSQLRGGDWEPNWVKPPNINYCAIADYDPVFYENHDYKVVFPTKPLSNNLLSRYAAHSDSNRYLLAAESLKASHMGYFIRGRREEPINARAEERVIVASYSKRDGVNSDSDIYKFPAMRNREVAQEVMKRLATAEYNLVICNLAATDMVGHLLPKRYDAALAAYASSSATALRICEAGLSTGYTVIWTSDHGNIETDSPSHTANPVLTIVARGEDKFAVGLPSYQACLNDVATTAAALLKLPIADLKSGFAGRNIVG